MPGNRRASPLDDCLRHKAIEASAYLGLFLSGLLYLLHMIDGGIAIFVIACALLLVRVFQLGVARLKEIYRD